MASSPWRLQRLASGDGILERFWLFLDMVTQCYDLFLPRSGRACLSVYEQAKRVCSMNTLAWQIGPKGHCVTSMHTWAPMCVGDLWLACLVQHHCFWFFMTVSMNQSPSFVFRLKVNCNNHILLFRSCVFWQLVSWWPFLNFQILFF